MRTQNTRPTAQHRVYRHALMANDSHKHSADEACASAQTDYACQSHGARIRRLIRSLLPPPHCVIGDPAQPYLLRWHLIPENRYCNVFLHCILKDDEDAVLHDHPWEFLTLLVKGAYREITFASPAVAHASRDASATDMAHHTRHAPAFAMHRARYAHRIDIVRSPAWTLVITGPTRRPWGFFRKEGWQAADSTSPVSDTR